MSRVDSTVSPRKHPSELRSYLITKYNERFFLLDIFLLFFFFFNIGIYVYNKYIKIPSTLLGRLFLLLLLCYLLGLVSRWRREVEVVVGRTKEGHVYYKYELFFNEQQQLRVHTHLYIRIYIYIIYRLATSCQVLFHTTLRRIN